MIKQNKYADWFRRFVWLGILANLVYAIPALFMPETLMHWLGFLPPTDTLWMRNTGMLLILLNLFYMPVATDPIRYERFARLTVAARFIAALFFLWIIFKVPYSGRVLPLFLTDLALGLFLAFFLYRTLRIEYAGSFEMQRSTLSRFLGRVWSFINHRLAIRWHSLGRYLGSFNLWAIRTDLREHNLHGTANLPDDKVPPLTEEPDHKIYRTPDGSYNDLDFPRMGRAQERFGRNAAHDLCWPNEESLMSPSPRKVSLQLMTREEFIPATTLNLLAAAWIQFQNHGWFNHDRDETKKIEIQLGEGDTWRDQYGEKKMLVSRTLADSTRPQSSSSLPTFQNTESHWWDGSQIYGRNLEQQLRLRTMSDGKMLMGEDGLLPIDEHPRFEGRRLELTGFNDNWWVGLSLLHSLFVKEHNSICDMLKLDNPRWDDHRLFNVARLINAALMAKIHTVEWTPGILGHPTLRVAMDANWWGLLGENLRRRYGRIGDSELLSGIMGSPTDHHSAPYSLTEEFVSVYRMHPLIPDKVDFYSEKGHEELSSGSFTEIQGDHTRDFMEKMMANNNGKMTDLFYSMGVNHPGAITLHNFPKALQNFERSNGERLDLAAIDILRDRERGVPRYNDFREMLRMKRITKFEELTNNRQWAKEIEAVYGDIDKVDLQVGMMAEPVPQGFGFSDTAFRIFVLMASRRLKSDRFFTTNWNEETYTEKGLAWVNDNDMSSVLLRHHPELLETLNGVTNAFAPWNRANKAKV